MVRIPEYTQQQLASSMTGAPPQNNSGMIIANSLMPTATSIGVGQGGSNGVGAGVGQLGASLRSAFAKMEAEQKRRQALLDTGAISNARTEFALGDIEARRRIREENPENPQAWASMYQEDFSQRKDAFVQSRPFNATVATALNTSLNSMLTQNVSTFAEIGVREHAHQQSTLAEHNVTQVERSVSEGEQTFGEGMKMLDAQIKAYRVHHTEGETLERYEKAKSNMRFDALSNRTISHPKEMIALLGEHSAIDGISREQRQSLIASANQQKLLQEKAVTKEYKKWDTSYDVELAKLEMVAAQAEGSQIGGMNTAAIGDAANRATLLWREYMARTPEEHKNPALLKKFSTFIKSTQSGAKRDQREHLTLLAQQRASAAAIRGAASAARGAEAAIRSARAAEAKLLRESDTATDTRVEMMTLSGELGRLRKNPGKNYERMNEVSDLLKRLAIEADSKGLITKDQYVNFRKAANMGALDAENGAPGPLSKFVRDVYTGLTKEIGVGRSVRTDEKPDLNKIAPIPISQFEKMGVTDPKVQLRYQDRAVEIYEQLKRHRPNADDEKTRSFAVYKAFH